MFEKATRMRLRFPFKGVASVEDLWDLSVEELYSVFKTLNSQHKSAQEETLLSAKTKEDDTLMLQIEIVKHIVAVKLAEAEKRKDAKERREKRQKLMEILASKEEASLQDKSIEELQKMLDELD